MLELPIETPTGGQVPLGTLADIRIAPNPTVIRHESVSRYIDVTASVDGRSVAAVEDDVERAIAQMAFPLEYHAEIVRDDDGISTALLIGMIVAATLGAFLLLQACFGTWRHAALALVLVPLSLAGGTLAVLIDGGTASLGSLVGFFRGRWPRGAPRVIADQTLSATRARGRGHRVDIVQLAQRTHRARGVRTRAGAPGVP